MNIQHAMKNPNGVFGTPEVLEASTEFTVAQKRAILMQWKDQLQQLLIADEESMLRADAKAGANADCLRRVTDILTRLPTQDCQATAARSLMTASGQSSRDRAETPRSGRGSIADRSRRQDRATTRPQRSWRRSRDLVVYCGSAFCYC
jgi:hypothetical protein